MKRSIHSLKKGDKLRFGKEDLFGDIKAGEICEVIDDTRTKIGGGTHISVRSKNYPNGRFFHSGELNYLKVKLVK